jgi:hypothetical protein
VLIRSLCFADPELVFAWIPVEAVAIFAIFTGIKMLREALKARLRAENLFLLLVAAPVVNNAIHIARALATALR